MKKIINAFVMSLSMFCALPCPMKTWDDEARPYMTLMLPLVGAWIGLLWFGAALLLQTLRLPLLLSAAFLTMFHYKITGFIHADGFMDCSDAMLSRRDIEGRRKILKDPCCGSFAVICIIFLVLTEFAAFASRSGISEAAEIWAETINHTPVSAAATAAAVSSAISNGFALQAVWGASSAKAFKTAFPWLLILIPVVSRALSGFCITVLKTLPGSQYSGSYREKLSKKHALVYAAYILAALAVCGILKSVSGALVIAGEMAAYAAAVSSAYKSLDGMNGDISGYAISLSECAAVIIMAVIK